MYREICIGNHTYSYYDGRATYVVIVEDHLNQLQDIQFKLACIVR